MSPPPPHTHARVNRAVCENVEKYRGADKSLARPGRKQATTSEDFDVHMSYLLSHLEEY